MQRIYLDHAATTPLDPVVIEVMTDLMKENYGNPSSIHHHGRLARIKIEDARKTIAELLGASTGEIFFTSSATEANNTILKGAVCSLGVNHIISAPTEHPCVGKVIQNLKESHQVKVTLLDVDPCGNIQLSQLEQVLDENASDKILVSLMHVNNEIGSLCDIEAVAQLCADKNVLLHSDMVQSIGKFKIDFSNINIHFACGSAHKFNGPKGVGFLYMDGDQAINPEILGGKQERNMRAGTENIYGIVGMATALERAYQHAEERSKILNEFRDYFKSKLLAISSEIQFLGNQDRLYHPGILNVSFPLTTKTDLMMMNLDIAGISSSAGSACSSGAMQQSPVLAALGVDPSRKSVRFSFSHLNTIDELDVVLKTIKEVLS